MKYTIKDLVDTAKEYEKNFSNILNSIGTPKHRLFLYKELRLNLKDVAIRKELGIYVNNPCRLGDYFTKPCELCTGWVKKKVKGMDMSGSSFYMVKETEQDKIRCEIKDTFTGDGILCKDRRKKVDIVTGKHLLN